MDSQGSEAIGNVLDLVRSHGAQLRLARVKPAVLEVLAADGIVDRLGESGIRATVYDAAVELISPSGSSGEGSS